MKKAAPALVVMAAGLGSRYGGLKQIDPLGPDGQIILDYSVYDAARAGFSRVIFVIRPELEQAFEDAIAARARRHMQVDYAYQTLDNLPEGLTAPAGRTKPLGTGHAVWCAAPVLADGQPFAVINADDFYGADAFQQMYAFLSEAEEQDHLCRCCMVGYKVENTLTENGTVARGVCQGKDGYLTSIVERTAIARGVDGVIRYEENGKYGEIPEGTPVSMNIWGFTPSFMDNLTGLLQAFFAEKLPQNPQKAEFYLPGAVDSLLQQGKADARLLTTDSRWFGVTYREDKASVQQALAQMTQAGIYPAGL